MHAKEFPDILDSMKKLVLLAFLAISTFAFASDTINPHELPKELIENLDFYSKLDMIENISVLEDVSDTDIQYAATAAELSEGGAN